MKKAAKRWTVPLARIGFSAKGVIFLCMGLFSAAAAFHRTGQAADSRDVIQVIAQQPFGRLLLIVLVGGLSCHVVWRFLEAFTSISGRDLGAEQLLSRLRSIFAGIIYGGITAGALKTLIGASAGQGSDGSMRSWTALLMSTALGPWLVGIFGAGMIAYGIYQWFRIYRGSFEKKLGLARLSAAGRRWVVRVCAVGIAARGLVFCLIGLFLIQAGLQSNPGQARGLGGALDSLRSEPYGLFAFAVAAIGLATYGVYCGVKARYSNFEVSR